MAAGRRIPFAIPGLLEQDGGSDVDPIVIPPVDLPPEPRPRLPAPISARKAPIVSPMACTIHTNRGVTLYTFLPNHQLQLDWNRRLREQSTCDLVVPRIVARNPQQEIIPWAHWISVWDTENALLWRGPVRSMESDMDTTTISSRDISVFAGKTRSPVTKRWDAAYPANIARVLWEQMIQQHGLDQTPVVLPDPLGDPFDFAVKRDEKLLEAVFEELTKLGLRWSVVSGVPVLGPMSLRPIAALSEDHFVRHDLRLIRDGAQMTNDVLVLGPDALGRARVPIANGLNLQSIVTVEDMFGVSNVDRAARQYVRHHSKARDAISGGSVRLRPDAPLTIAQMIPSSRVTVDVFERLTVMELDSVSVSQSAEESSPSVAVTLESVDDDIPELDQLQGQQ